MTSRRLGLLLVVSSIAAAVVVLVLVLTGRDGGSGQTLRGDASAGYPLRGELAEDDDAIDGAVAAWRDAEDSTAPTEDDDVTVLWIGPAGDEQVAVLAGQQRLAEIARRGDGDWAVRATAVGGGRLDPRKALGVGRSVLVPDTGHSWSYRRFGRGPEDLRDVEGLFRVNPDSMQGFIWPLRSLSKTDLAFLYGIGVGQVAVDGDTLGELHRVAFNPQAGGLWSALRAADAELDEMPTPARYGDQYLDILEHDAYVYEMVALALERPPRIALTVGHDDTATVLGVGEKPRGTGVVAAGSIVFDGRTWPVLAGLDAPTMRGRIGSLRIAADGPFYVEDYGRFDEDETPPRIVAQESEDVEPLAP